MSGASLEAGISIDLATKDDIDAGFSKVLDRIPRRKRKPLLRRLPTSGVVVAGTPLVLAFGDVAAGYTYEIVHCVVVGADASTVLAGASAALYLGNPSSPSLGQILQPGIAVPGFWNFGGSVIYSHFGDQTYVVVTGAAAGSNVSAILSVIQHTEDTVEAGGM